MKRFFALSLALLLAVLAPCSSFAAYQPPFELPAQCCGLVMNLDTGEVLWEQNADQPHAIASLTKMMTSLLLLESGQSLDTVVTVPARLGAEIERIKDWDGAYLDLRIGEKITLQDLLYSTMLPSTNDTASTIADHLTGGDIPAFVEQMNQRAAQMGCTNTQFSCPHGLYNEGNWSTARDLALIAQTCLENEAFMEVVTTTSYWLDKTNIHTTVRSPNAPEGKYLQLNSTIHLQRRGSPFYRAYAQGMKTGFTDAAGRCLVTTAQLENESYLLVFLGMPNQKLSSGIQVQFEYATQLLDWVIDRFEPESLPALGESPASLPLSWCEEADTVPLYPAGQLTGLLLDTQLETTYTYTLPQSLQAPLEAGQPVGTMVIHHGGRLLGSVELVTDKAYPYSAKLYWQERLAPYHTHIALGAACLLLSIAFVPLALRRRA